MCTACMGGGAVTRRKAMQMGSVGVGCGKVFAWGVVLALGALWVYANVTKSSPPEVDVTAASPPLARDLPSESTPSSREEPPTSAVEASPESSPAGAATSTPTPVEPPVATADEPPSDDKEAVKQVALEESNAPGFPDVQSMILGDWSLTEVIHNEFEDRTTLVHVYMVLHKEDGKWLVKASSRDRAELRRQIYDQLPEEVKGAFEEWESHD